MHSLEGTGGTDVVRVLSAHAWVRSHSGDKAVRDGGGILTSAMPAAMEMMATGGKELREVCSSTSLDGLGYI